MDIWANISNAAEFIWALSQENVSSRVSDQVRLKLACSATEASMGLEFFGYRNERHYTS